MVKSVAGEETRLKSAEDRLSRSSITAEVGIIIGKLSLHLERGFVYDLIPTPPTDGGSPACSLKVDAGGWDERKKGSRGGKASAEAIVSLLIDGEWVAEHARQVSRMLLGGMSVIGIYVWSSEASFKATSASALSQAVRVVAQATPSFESETNERLLIHISHSPKRWACRNCAIASVDLRPCDFKMGKLLPMLQTYRCMYGFDIRIPIDVVTTSNTFKNVLHSGISRHAKELQSALALCDGKLVTENQQVTSEGLHNVELLLPFKSDAQHGSSGDVAGLLVFRGAICAYAYLSPKEPASQAISDLKNDIINSLKARLDLVFEEGEDTLDMASNDLGKASDEMVSGPIHQLILHELRKPLVLSFPRRVLVPWLSGTFICDYLLPSETFEDVRDRCRDLLSMEAPAESTGSLELETDSEPPITSSFWDVVRGNPIPSNEEPKNRTDSVSSKKSKHFNFTLQIALLILLVAVFLGGSITVLNPRRKSRCGSSNAGEGQLSAFTGSCPRKLCQTTQLQLFLTSKLWESCPKRSHNVIVGCSDIDHDTPEFKWHGASINSSVIPIT